MLGMGTRKRKTELCPTERVKEMSGQAQKSKKVNTESGGSGGGGSGIEMGSSGKPTLSELNQLVCCSLCDGYLVDACTLSQCVHSFCRGCLVRHLSKDRRCPDCAADVKLDDPVAPAYHVDTALQDLVYKLVPNVYKNELKRRGDFYRQACERRDKASSTGLPVKQSTQKVIDKHLVELAAFVLTPDEHVSLAVEYAATEDSTTLQSTSTGESPSKTKKKRSRSSSAKSRHNRQKKASFRRYFRCPAGMTIGSIKKLLRLKLELGTKFEVLLRHGDSKGPLEDNTSLMDIAYAYSWRRDSPMQLYFSLSKVEPPEIEMPPDLEPMPELTRESSMPRDVVPQTVLANDDDEDSNSKPVSMVPHLAVNLEPSKFDPDTYAVRTPIITTAHVQQKKSSARKRKEPGQGSAEKKPREPRPPKEKKPKKESPNKEPKEKKKWNRRNRNPTPPPEEAMDALASGANVQPVTYANVIQSIGQSIMTNLLRLSEEKELQSRSSTSKNSAESNSSSPSPVPAVQRMVGAPPFAKGPRPLFPHTGAAIAHAINRLGLSGYSSEAKRQKLSPLVQKPVKSEEAMEQQQQQTSQQQQYKRELNTGSESTSTGGRMNNGTVIMTEKSEDLSRSSDTYYKRAVEPAVQQQPLVCSPSPSLLKAISPVAVTVGSPTKAMAEKMVTSAGYSPSMAAVPGSPNFGATTYAELSPLITSPMRGLFQPQMASHADQMKEQQHQKSGGGTTTTTPSPMKPPHSFPPPHMLYQMPFIPPTNLFQPQNTGAAQPKNSSNPHHTLLSR